MNPKHVTDLELSKQLFETGITKDFESQFYRVENTAIGHKDPAHGKVKHRSDCCMVGGRVTSSGCIKYTPALLLSELLEILTSSGNLLGIEVFNIHSLQFFANHAYKSSYRPKGHSTALEACSALASYLIREGKFNNNAK